MGPLLKALGCMYPLKPPRSSLIPTSKPAELQRKAPGPGTEQATGTLPTLPVRLIPFQSRLSLGLSFPKPNGSSPWPRDPPQLAPHISAHPHLGPHSDPAQAREEFGGSFPKHLSIATLTAEQRNHWLSGGHKLRNILMKNKCLYRETSKPPGRVQVICLRPALGLLFLPPPRSKAAPAACRDKYFK